jgi:preprotein translocase subunit YajC
VSLPLLPLSSLSAYVPTVLAADGDAGGLGDTMFMLLIVGAIFYFILIRPAGRERKRREDRIKSLKKYDRVVTNAGIHGIVVALDPERVQLRVDDKTNTRIWFSRAAIWQVESADAPAETEVKKEAGAAAPSE